MVGDPSPQKTRRHRDHRLAVLDALDPQRLQPGAIGGVADFVPEKAEHPLQFAGAGMPSRRQPD